MVKQWRYAPCRGFWAQNKYIFSGFYKRAEKGPFSALLWPFLRPALAGQLLEAFSGPAALLPFFLRRTGRAGPLVARPGQGPGLFWPFSGPFMALFGPFLALFIPFFVAGPF